MQHASLAASRSEKGTSVSSRSLGARCRNSVPSCPDEPHIGNYRLLKTIGKGNFAKVKLARHVLTGREVRAWLRSDSHRITTPNSHEQLYSMVLLSNVRLRQLRTRPDFCLCKSIKQ